MSGQRRLANLLEFIREGDILVTRSATGPRTIADPTGEGVMFWLGMLALGAVVGYVVTFALVKIEDWKKPISIVTGVLSALVGGSFFAFIQYMGVDKSALALYPIGLGYGALCTNLRWVTQKHDNRLQAALAVLHVLAFGAATVGLFLIFLSPSFRELLPR